MIVYVTEHRDDDGELVCATVDNPEAGDELHVADTIEAARWWAESRGHEVAGVQLPLDVQEVPDDGLTSFQRRILGRMSKPK